MVVEWTFRPNGTDNIYTALDKVDFLKCVLKSFIGKKQGRPGMNFDGSPRTGLGGDTLSSPYAPPGAKMIK